MLKARSEARDVFNSRTGHQPMIHLGPPAEGRPLPSSVIPTIITIIAILVRIIQRTQCKGEFAWDCGWTGTKTEPKRRPTSTSRYLQGNSCMKYVLLAPKGALYVIMCHYWSTVQRATFFRFSLGPLILFLFPLLVSFCHSVPLEFLRSFF